MSADLLFDVRNNFYLGAFQQCINEAQKVKVKSEDEILSKNLFMYRAYIALNKYSVPLSEIDSLKANTSLRSVRRLAEYMNSSERRPKILQEIMTELESESIGNNEIGVLTASIILLHEDNVEDSLRILSKCESLECQAAMVQCFLKLHRADIASKMVKKMQEVDEDCTITQLALASVNLALGKEKLKDAFYIYQEMIDKYGPTSTLLVSKAASLIQQQKYEEAEKVLQDAIQRDSTNPDAVVGLLVVSQFLAKSSEITNRYINQMKQEFPNHPWTKELNKFQEMLDKY